MILPLQSSGGISTDALINMIRANATCYKAIFISLDFQAVCDWPHLCVSQRGRNGAWRERFRSLRRQNGQTNIAVRQVMTCRRSLELGSRRERLFQSWVNAQKGAVVCQATRLYSMRWSSKLPVVQFALQDLAPELPEPKNVIGNLSSEKSMLER